ncbi:ABC transporter substrate-binding protein [Pelomonas sp. KK5]|uniref:ABC transporter substrate-binding protein n=1 Tax=Pelomonas sp. KK5 TaxID=1855730 RepID=UPI00097C9927|nr:ABC transporter substrate-binding protein [Pelomonas sp. KK5]
MGVPTVSSIASRRVRPLLCIALLCAVASARADEKFTYMTSWFAQAEHGGFYQAQALGLYTKAGLDVTIRMGGPQVNAVQIMAAGQADCVMGSTDIQMTEVRDSGVPVSTVAAFFQKDPSVLIAHEDVKKLEDLKGKTIYVAPQAGRSFWPWLKERYGFTDAQSRPYTFNIQPFVADRNAAQQGFLTSEPFAIQKAGVKATVLLLGDRGFPAYSTTVTCMDATLRKRAQVVAAFIKASAEGWKSYLADPAPGNALIRKANPDMSDEQLAYSLQKMKETGLVTGGDAATQGIGVMTDARARASWDFLVAAKLIDPARTPLAATYSTAFVKDAKVLP